MLTSSELRKLVRAHNILSKIVIPKGSSRDDLIKLIEKNGYMVDEEKKSIKPKVQRGKQITLSQAEVITKPKPKTQLQKQKAQEKKAEKEAMKKKQEREIRKKAVEEEKERQKKSTLKGKSDNNIKGDSKKMGDKLVMMYLDDRSKKNLNEEKIKSIKKSDDIKKFIEEYTKSKMTDPQYNRIKKWLGEISNQRGVITIREMKTEWIIQSRTNKTPFIRGDNIHMKKQIGRGNKPK